MNPTLFFTNGVPYRSFDFSISFFGWRREHHPTAITILKRKNPAGVSMGRAFSMIKAD